MSGVVDVTAVALAPAALIDDHSSKHCMAMLPGVPDGAFESDSDDDEMPSEPCSRSQQRHMCTSGQQSHFEGLSSCSLDGEMSVASAEKDAGAPLIAAVRSNRRRDCIMGPGRESIAAATMAALLRRKTRRYCMRLEQTEAALVALQRRSTRRNCMIFDRAETGLSHLTEVHTLRDVAKAETSCCPP